MCSLTWQNGALMILFVGQYCSVTGHNVHKSLYVETGHFVAGFVLKLYQIYVAVGVKKKKIYVAVSGVPNISERRCC